MKVLTGFHEIRSHGTRAEPLGNIPGAPVLWAEDPTVLLRMVVARYSGIFTWTIEPEGGGRLCISRDQVVGAIDRLGQSTPVASPFAGLLMGPLVVSGERVRANQPLAWMTPPSP